MHILGFYGSANGLSSVQVDNTARRCAELNQEGLR